MENVYSGTNSVTEYFNVKKKTLINITVWAFLLLLVLTTIFVLLVMCISNAFVGKYDEVLGHVLALGLFFTSAAVVLVLIGLNIALIAAEIVRATRANKSISLYSQIEITNVSKVLIDYDTKQWLTAPKDTYHPLAFHLDVNKERLNLKTQAIFTNSSFYCHVPKHKMPEILKNKNYINNYALVGYYEKNNEGIIIKIIKD